MPLDLDSCIAGVFTPGNIGASSGQTPVQPVIPSFSVGNYGVGLAQGIGAALGIAPAAAGTASGVGAAAAVGAIVGSAPSAITDHGSNASPSSGGGAIAVWGSFNLTSAVSGSRVVVMATGYGGSNTWLLDATIGGDQAFIHNQARTNGDAGTAWAGIISAPLPADTTPDIRLTFNALASGLAIHVLTVDGGPSWYQYDDAVAHPGTGVAATTTINIPYNGMLFVAAAGRGGTLGGFTPTGYTEDSDASYASQWRGSHGHAVNLSPETARSLGADSTADFDLLVAVAFGGSSGAWTPASLSLGAEYTHAALSGSDGDALAAWNDAVGSNHLTQATTGNKPNLAAANLNGNNVVRFNAAGPDYFNVPNILSGSAGFVTFIVKSADETPASAAVAGGPLGSWGTSAQDCHYPFTDNNIYDDWGTTVRKGAFNPTPNLESWRIITINSRSSIWQYMIDGSLAFETTTNTVGFGTAAVVGRARNASANYFDGWMARLGFKCAAVKYGDLRRYEAYSYHALGQTSLTLHASHPFRSNPP